MLTIAQHRLRRVVQKLRSCLRGKTLDKVEVKRSLQSSELEAAAQSQRSSAYDDHVDHVGLPDERFASGDPAPGKWNRRPGDVLISLP